MRMLVESLLAELLTGEAKVIISNYSGAVGLSFVFAKKIYGADCPGNVTCSISCGDPQVYYIQLAGTRKWICLFIAMTHSLPSSILKRIGIG